MMDISLENIYYEYEYTNEQKWKNINSLQGIEHKGVQYTNNRTSTSSLLFSNFDIDNDDYSHIYCTITGLNQSDKHIKVNMAITDQDKIQTTYKIEKIAPNLFNYTFDLLDILPTKRVKDLNIQLYFDETTPSTNIIITNLFLTTPLKN